MKFASKYSLASNARANVFKKYKESIVKRTRKHTFTDIRYLLRCNMERKIKRRTIEDLPDIRPETIQKMGIAESISYAHFEMSIHVVVCFCASNPCISLHHFSVGWRRDI